MSESSSSLLCVIFDINPLAWGLKTLLEAHANGEGQRQETIVQGLDATLTFINSFLLMTHGNQVAVVGVHPEASEFMYPNSKSKGSVTTAAQVNKDVTEKFRQILSSDVFTKLESVDQTYSSRFASGLAKTLCFINRKRHSIKNLSARILVITCGMDHLADQYLSLINGAFAAQDMNIKIDSVLIEREGTNAALQQLSKVTGGIYTQVREPQMLLQTLLVYHLADDNTRESLATIPQQDVDSRAICFNSKNPVDIGHVCSVCLSVFSTFTPMCSTCDSVFKMPQILSRKRRRPK